MCLHLSTQVESNLLLKRGKALCERGAKVSEASVNLMLQLVKVSLEIGDRSGGVCLACFKLGGTGVEAGQFGVIRGLQMGCVLNGPENNGKASLGPGILYWQCIVRARGAAFWNLGIEKEGSGSLRSNEPGGMVLTDSFLDFDNGGQSSIHLDGILQWLGIADEHPKGAHQPAPPAAAPALVGRRRTERAGAELGPLPAQPGRSAVQTAPLFTFQGRSQDLLLLSEERSGPEGSPSS